MSSRRPDPPGERIRQSQEHSLRAASFYGVEGRELIVDENQDDQAGRDKDERYDHDHDHDAQSDNESLVQVDEEEYEEDECDMEPCVQEITKQEDSNETELETEKTVLDDENVETQLNCNSNSSGDRDGSRNEHQQEDQQEQFEDNQKVDPILDFRPDTSKADSLSFATLCRRMEILWLYRTRKMQRQSKDELWDVIVPNSLRKYIDRGSYFPLMRLLVPDMDTSRPHTGMKERTIATAWADALGFAKTSRLYRKLVLFNDPSVTGVTATGDLSMVVHEILQERFKANPSNLTLGQVNQLLDELVSIKNGPRRSVHDWRENTQTQFSQSQSQPKRGPRKDQLRMRWVEKLLGKTENPLEHKWIIRILLQRMEIGFGSKTILSRYYPVALDLYRMNNNLKSVCTTLCNPAWWKQHKRLQKEKNPSAQEGEYMELPSGRAELGNTIAPMLAQRTFFASAMSDLSKVHQDYAKRLSRDDPKRKFLPLKFPAFCAEVKLDGERIICHLQRGQVTMQTRRSVWYSDLYSPVLGPGLRKAIRDWDVDVILDGEVIAWDNNKQETIPFGNNRPVALARRKWMENQGLIDPRDCDQHQDQDDLNVMRFGRRDHTAVDADSGSKCFLKYMVFDLLYVGGPDACELQAQALGVSEDDVREGSIIHLSGFQRKRILHRLISQQKNEIEFVSAVVVRPNGASIKSEDYFSRTSPPMDEGYLAADVDCIERVIKGAIPDWDNVDSILRCGMTDTEISKLRTEVSDQFYSEVIDKRGLEGVVFKDLNAAYLLDGRKYWFKHKPENEDISHASDIDLLILGGFYATGFGPSGLINSFLLGCVDDENPDCFLTVCKINGGGIDRDTQKKLLEETGYQKQTRDQEWDSGRWFKEYHHGKTIPEFISKRSFQHPGENKGPVFDKTKYPDLWINPEDSVILTIKAGELVVSDAFTAGITLRFPRIEKVRLKFDGDAKQPNQVESLNGLQQLFRETLQLREGSSNMDIDENASSSGRKRRFQTPEEHLRKRATRRNLKNDLPEWRLPTAEKRESSALEGLSIVVLEGTYRIDEGNLDAEEAKEQGWWETAKEVKSRDDVFLFISKHGGTAKTSVSKATNFIVGGQPDDARVVVYHRGLEKSTAEKRKTRSKTALTFEDMMRIGYIRKWTYLFAIVHEWIRDVSQRVKEEFVDDTEVETTGATTTGAVGNFGCCILKTHGHLLRPSRHHFLKNTDTWADSQDDIKGISLSKDLTLVDFKRALLNVKSKKHKTETCGTMIPWQFAAADKLPPEQRWVVAGPAQKLWPYRENDSQSEPVVMYPDVFEDDFGLRSHEDAVGDVLSGKSKRLDQLRKEIGSVAAAVPLARVMGVQLVPHLTSKTTHILCELVGDYRTVTWDHFDAEKFRNPKHARRMRVRLSGMRGFTKVIFVSPTWIQEKWHEK